MCSETGFALHSLKALNGLSFESIDSELQSNQLTNRLLTDIERKPLEPLEPMQTNMPSMGKSCDTFVVLPPLTAHNLTVFGKNSDRPNGEVQEIVYHPHRSHAIGPTTEVRPANAVIAPHIYSSGPRVGSHYR